MATKIAIAFCLTYKVTYIWPTDVKKTITCGPQLPDIPLS